MLSYKSRKFEKNQSNATDTSKQNDSLNTFKRQLYKLEEKPECSQLSNQPHKNIGDLIKEKQADKEACDNAFSDLLKSTTRAKKKLEKILQNEELSLDNSVERQLAVIEKDPYLMSLIEKDIIEIKNEKKFLIEEKSRISTSELLCSTMTIHIRKALEHYLTLFHACGIDLDAHLDKKHLEIPQYFSIERYRKTMDRFPKLHKHIALTQVNFLTHNEDKFRNQEIFKRIQDIAQKRASLDELREKLETWEKCKKIIQGAKEKFEVAIYDPSSIEKASRETLLIKPKYGREALQILQKAYIQQIQHNRTKMLEKVEKNDILKNFQDAWNKEEKKLDLLSIHQIVKEHDENAEHIKEEQEILQEGLKLTVEHWKLYENKYDEMINGSSTIRRNALTFYHFIEKNITRRLYDSLDALEKKSREALRLLENEIKELDLFQHSERSNQAKAAMEQPSPADTLQNHLETSFTDTNMTDQRKHIVTSYMHGLFEKSHHQFLDKETIAKFCKENIEEAKQVGAYLEQKHFIHHKIRDEAIKLAIHLKHEFGFPIHHASIDADFNIVRSRPSKKNSAKTPKLEINPQGKILKDNRVQRVYLIGFQDEAKPMALLAIQSVNTSYPKFGAHTPLPTGGVVDVVTAQYTRQDQPNLYKATLSLETLQETHGQKEIDMPTLEFFETETVTLKSCDTETVRNNTALYDVTTFAGKVKDRPHSVLPDNSLSDNSKEEKAYQETTRPCMVNLGELLSAVRNIVEGSGRFCPSWKAMMYIKREIAGQVLGKETVPKSDETWKKNGETCWADFHEYSTSMNMFAKYLAVAYREELGLAGSK